MARGRRRGAAAWLAVLLLVAAGCGGSDHAEPADQADPARGLDSPAFPAATAPTGLVGRCASLVPDPEAVAEERIEGPPGLALTAGVFEAPDAPVALVLLHQIGGAGLCGWGPFATQAARRGVASVAVDLCGYGDSACDDRYVTDPAAQVEVAADWARTHLDVDRVVVVGASMGGSQAVRAVAGGAPVDAWADLSGPSAWDGVPLLSVADRVERPGLVVQARSDGAAEYDAARRLAGRTGARFLDGGAGHGWDLVTDLDGRLTATGLAVLRFARSG